MTGDAFSATWTLTRLAFRRDRLKLIAWVVSITALVTMSTRVILALSPQELTGLVAMRLASPALRAFDAPILGVSPGEAVMLRITFLTYVLVAMLSAAIVVRHTRENEETGCAEMMGSTAVGRNAQLASALLVATGTNVLLAILIAGLLLVHGLPIAGSLLAGAGFGAIGMVFASVAAVSVQLSASTRGAGGLSTAIMSLAFLVNAVGNMLGEVVEGPGVVPAWPVWLSPLGWLGRMCAFSNNNWWLLTLFGGAFAVLTATAFLLVGRRDVGSSILPVRPGPARAHPRLLSPLGLAWRLQRGTFAGWAIPIVVCGLAFGAISDEFGVALEGLELFEDLVISADIFLFSLIGFGAAIISIHAVQALLRLRSEEITTLELILATSVTRTRWMMSHITCSVLGTISLILLFALSIGLAAGASVASTADLVKVALFQSPAVLVLAGFAILVFAVVPRQAGLLSWLAVLAGLLTGPFFGTLLGLSSSVQSISPFSHLPVVPEPDLMPIAVLTVVGVVLGSLALGVFRARDLRL